MKHILLTKGYTTVVDDKDFAWLNQWKWSVQEASNGRAYALRTIRNHVTKKRSRVYMHRLILQLSVGCTREVDHKDRNGLNNRRDNLRRATTSQNQANSCLPSHNTSGFKGVSWNARQQRWKAEMRYRGRQYFLGYFLTARAAKKVRDCASKRMFGAFAREA
jgi:hypothetical protein